MGHGGVLCDGIKWHFGRACVLITAGEECHHFKRGEKEEVRMKRFFLCALRDVRIVFSPSPQRSAESYTHSIPTSEPEVAC